MNRYLLFRIVEGLRLPSYIGQFNRLESMEEFTGSTNKYIYVDTQDGRWYELFDYLKDT